MQDEEENQKLKRKVFSRGGKNLIILGLISIIVAVSTTGVSLAIYHNSGDIYLDRSRPGFLPDEEEVEEAEKEEEYDFSKSGKLSISIIEEYLDKLDNEVKDLDSYDKPFNEEVLSDENLGIPAVETGGETE